MSNVLHAAIANIDPSYEVLGVRLDTNNDQVVIGLVFTTRGQYELWDYHHDTKDYLTLDIYASRTEAYRRFNVST